MTIHRGPEDDQPIDPELDMSNGWLHPGDEGYPYEEVINEPHPVCAQCSIYDAHDWCIGSFMLNYTCYCTSPKHVTTPKEGGVL